MKMLGILTNYKEWVFTKYNFETEVNNAIVSKVHKCILNERNPFEISQKFTIMNDNFELDIAELQKVVNVLEWLAISFNS